MHFEDTVKPGGEVVTVDGGGGGVVGVHGGGSGVVAVHSGGSEVVAVDIDNGRGGCH